MSIKINDDATATAVYLSKIEDYLSKVKEAKTIEALKELLNGFLIEHYQHELDMAAIRLAAATPASRDQRLEAADSIKAQIQALKPE